MLIDKHMATDLHAARYRYLAEFETIVCASSTLGLEQHRLLYCSSHTLYSIVKVSTKQLPIEPRGLRLNTRLHAL